MASNGAPVGDAMMGQVVYVVDESEDDYLAEVEIHVFGGLKVRIERVLLAGFTRADVPVYSSPKGQGWWGQNAPLLLGTGDSKSALVEPHPKAMTPEMERINFVPRELFCAGISGVPVGAVEEQRLQKNALPGRARPRSWSGGLVVVGPARRGCFSGPGGKQVFF